MDSETNKDKIAWMLRSLLVNYPLPGVSIGFVAEKLGIKRDALQAKLRNEQPASLKADELLEILAITRDTRALNLILPDGIVVIDTFMIESSPPVVDLHRGQNIADLQSAGVL